MDEYLSAMTYQNLPRRLLPFSHSPQAERSLSSRAPEGRVKLARVFFVIVLLALGAACGGAEGRAGFPFALDLLGDSALIGGGVALYGGSLLLQPLKPKPDRTAVDPGAIPFFDRAYPAQPSTALSTAGDDLALVTAALPLVLLPGRSAGEMLTIGVMYVESLGLGYGLDSLLKSTVVRYRPYAYATSTPADFSNSDITASFPSSHATLAFSAAVFAGYVFDELNPGSSLGPWVWVAGLGVATAASTLLVASGDHFISDVVAGAAIGAASGFLVPFLHKRLPVVQTKAGDAISSVALDLGGGGIGVRLSLRP
jgi:membrane-associated phospholipid phosphatase